MTTYFKAVRPDGGSFYDPDFRWLPDGWHTGDPIPDGWTVVHPDYSPTGGDARRYLSVATVATDCTGMRWPCVLLEVEPVYGYVRAPDPYSLPSKRAASAWRVVRELPATDALGPQGVEVAALIERAGQLSVDDDAYHGAWRAARRAAYRAARDAARDAAWVAARDAAAGCSAWLAAVALVVRDLISREHYDMLTRPWRTVVGPIHADDCRTTDAIEERFDRLTDAEADRFEASR